MPRPASAPLRRCPPDYRPGELPEPRSRQWELTGLAGDGLQAPGLYLAVGRADAGSYGPSERRAGPVPLGLLAEREPMEPKEDAPLLPPSLTTAAASAAMALAVSTCAKIALAICSLLSTRSANDNALLATAEGGKAPAEVTTIGRFSQ